MKSNLLFYFDVTHITFCTASLCVWLFYVIRFQGVTCPGFALVNIIADLFKSQSPRGLTSIEALAFTRYFSSLPSMPPYATFRSMIQLLSSSFRYFFLLLLSYLPSAAQSSALVLFLFYPPANHPLGLLKHSDRRLRC